MEVLLPPLIAIAFCMVYIFCILQARVKTTGRDKAVHTKQVPYTTKDAPFYVKSNKTATVYKLLLVVVLMLYSTAHTNIYNRYDGKNN